MYLCFLLSAAFSAEENNDVMRMMIAITGVCYASVDNDANTNTSVKCVNIVMLVGNVYSLGRKLCAQKKDCDYWQKGGSDDIVVALSRVSREKKGK